MFTIANYIAIKNKNVVYSMLSETNTMRIDVLTNT